MIKGFKVSRELVDRKKANKLFDELYPSTQRFVDDIMKLVEKHGEASPFELADAIDGNLMFVFMTIAQENAVDLCVQTAHRIIQTKIQRVGSKGEALREMKKGSKDDKPSYVG